MELVCPSCEARYQLPPGSIGQNGRQVSCMNCGHHWHAYPPLQLGAQRKPERSPSAGISFQGPAGDVPEQPNPLAGGSQTNPYADPHGGQAAMPPGGPREMSAMDPAMGRGGPHASRTEQLAEIRQMLSEVQPDGRGAGGQTPAYDPTRTMPATPEQPSLLNPNMSADQAAMRRADEQMRAQHDALTRQDSYDDQDDLRNRIDKAEERGKTQRSDVRSIKRRHERRQKRRKAAEQAGSGAFLTGFLLIAIIAATMSALYMLKPQIIARAPELEASMEAYVNSIDTMRAELASLVGTVRDWLAERFG